MTRRDDLASNRIEALYRDLTCAFPHPFDWMGLLHKPPFWRWSWRKPHQKVVAIFANHGFTLTDEVADDYHAPRFDDWETYAMDAGGKICFKLSRALIAQKDAQKGDGE
jgi:hypothetical protein